MCVRPTCTKPIYSTYRLDFPTDASIHNGKHEFCVYIYIYIYIYIYSFFVAGQIKNSAIILSSLSVVFITIQNVVSGFEHPVML